MTSHRQQQRNQCNQCNQSQHNRSQRNQSQHNQSQRPPTPNPPIPPAQQSPNIATSPPPEQKQNQIPQQTCRLKVRSGREGQPRRAPRCQPSNREKYLPTLNDLMSWRYHVPYLRDYELTQDDLQRITDNEIVRWAKHRIYGDADADDAIDPPLHYRHNSVLNWKKALSFFMPNAHLQWNDDSQAGNPTQSCQMARLLKNVKRMQVQCCGVPSRIRRPMHPEEYEQMMELIAHLDINELSLCVAAYFCFQFAVIGRLDDTAEFWERPEAI